MLASNCPRCKKVAIIESGLVICNACVSEESDTLDRVRDYLKENPGLTLLQLAKQTEVSAKKIEGYIRTGKIELTDPEIECEKCKIKIHKGRFCADCEEAFVKHSMNSVAKMKELKEIEQRSKGQGMHIDGMKRKST